MECHKGFERCSSVFCLIRPPSRFVEASWIVAMQQLYFGVFSWWSFLARLFENFEVFFSELFVMFFPNIHRYDYIFIYFYFYISTFLNVYIYISNIITSGPAFPRCLFFCVEYSLPSDAETQERPLGRSSSLILDLHPSQDRQDLYNTMGFLGLMGEDVVKISKDWLPSGKLT